MTKKSDAPAIRFKGFSDAWEQRKLGDISEIKTGPFGSTLHADDYVSDGTPIITTEHFKTSALPRSKNGLPQVSDSDYKRLTAYTLDAGDIVFSRVGSVDINALITPFQSNWLFSGRVLRVRPQTDVSSQFLHTRLETESIKTDIRTRAVGQTMPSINTEILKITPLVLPSSVAEQEQIGSYFAALDNLITLHQRQSFSHSTPDISLSVQLIHPFYTSSWEQRKLGDIADIVGGGTPSTGNQSYWDGDIDWYAPAEIADQIYANSSQKKITGLGYENSSAKMLPPGTVLFTSRAGIGKTAILTRKGCTNQGFQSIVPHRGELDSYFIFSRTEELKRYGELVGAGSTFVEVSGKQMAVMELMMPPTMREQQTIGGFFQQLDHLITLHQRKGKAAVSGCSNDANNPKGVCCKARDFGYKCHKKDESK